MEDISVILEWILLLTVATLFFYIPIAMGMKNDKYRKNIKKKIEGQMESGEFEEIYNNAIQFIDMNELKKEYIKNIIKLILIFLIPLIYYILLFIIMFHFRNYKVASFMFVISIFVVFFARIFYKKPKSHKHINEIIKSLVINITGPIEIHNDMKKYWQTYDSANFIFRQKLSHTVKIIDGIGYISNSDSNVKIARLQAEYSTKHGIEKFIQGIVFKFERNKFYSDNILIEMNMLFDMNGIFKNNSGKSFKDLFDIVSKNKEYAELIINDEIKYKLVNLYKKYGMTFDTLLVGNDIYIRFLVGDLFKVEDLRFSIVDEKKFKKDYYMLKNVVQIAEEIDNMF